MAEGDKSTYNIGGNALGATELADGARAARVVVESGGGGGGSGDASAANQVAGNATLAAIDGHVDGLETLSGAGNTLLTAIDGHVDGLETVLGATNGAKVVTDADGTIQQYLRGIVVTLISFISAGIKLLAGENHIGEVGGYKRSSSIEFVRPSDTTAYAALDVIGVNLAVTGATNATPIVVTTATHSLADGDPVTITGVVGNTAANGSFFVKVTTVGSSTTFGLYSDAALATPVAGNGAYTSGGNVARVFKFANMARIVGQNGYIVKGQLFTDQKTFVARVKVHLFSSPPTAILDNSPYLRLWANRTNRSGEIVFQAASTEDPTNSTAASVLATPNTPGCNLPLYFGTAAADTALYGIVETLDAFSPASGQSFHIRFGNEDD